MPLTPRYSRRIGMLPHILTVLILFLPCSTAAPDTSSLHTPYSTIPYYRSGLGTNILPLSIGTPAQPVNLTLSTSVPFVLLLTDACDFCLPTTQRTAGLAYLGFNPNESSTLQRDNGGNDRVTYTALNPGSETSLYAFEGATGSDVFGLPQSATPTSWPILLVDRLLAPTSSPYDPSALHAASAHDTDFPPGSVGIFGLGYNTDNPTWSPLDAALSTLNGPARPGTDQDGLVVGLSVKGYEWYPGQQAGELHWGGIPSNSYVGDFVYFSADSSRGAGWGFPVDSLAVDGETIGLSDYYGVLDPGYDEIWMPTQAAERFYGRITNARRNTDDPTRWTFPCSTTLPSLTLHASGRRINLNPQALILPALSAPAIGTAAGICVCAVAAWPNGSVAEVVGEVRLGTAFLSGVYSTLYYSPSGSYIGIAGKPGSINPSDLSGSGSSSTSSSPSSRSSPSDNDGSSNTSHPNGKLAGILIGSLLAAAVILLILLYARNKSRFQSVWYRAMRRQRRMVDNAIVRGATIPPMMPVPMGMRMGMPIPPPMGMMGPGMGMGMGVGAGIPLGSGMGMVSGGMAVHPGALGAQRHPGAMPHVPHLHAQAPPPAPPPPRSHFAPHHRRAPSSPSIAPHTASSSSKSKAAPLSPRFTAGPLPSKHLRSPSSGSQRSARAHSHADPQDFSSGSRRFSLPVSGLGQSRQQQQRTMPPLRQGPESYIAGFTGPGETGDAYGPASTGVNHQRQASGPTGQGAKRMSMPASHAFGRGSR